MKKKLFSILVPASSPVIFVAACANTNNNDDFPKQKFYFLDSDDFMNLMNKLQNDYQANKELITNRNFIDSLSKNVIYFNELKSQKDDEKLRDSNDVKDKYQEIIKFLNSSSFDYKNINNYFSNLLHDLDNLIKKINKDNAQSELRNQITKIFNQNNNDSFNNIKQQIFESMPKNINLFSNNEFQNKLNENLKTFNSNYKNLQNLSKYSFNNEVQISQSDFNINNFINSKSMDFNSLNQKFSELNQILSDELTQKQKILDDKLKNYHNEIKSMNIDYKFDANLINYLKTKSNSLFVNAQDEQFLSTVNYINQQIKEIEEFRKQNSIIFSDVIKVVVNKYLHLKNTNFDSLATLNELKDEVKKVNKLITSFIILNNYRSKDIIRYAEALSQKINSSKFLTTKQKDVLLDQSKNLANTLQVQYLTNEIKAQESNFAQLKKDFIQQINANNQFSTSIKTYFKTRAYSKDSLQEFNEFKDYPLQFILLLENLKNEIQKTNDAVAAKHIDTKKILDFFLSDSAILFSKIYNSELNTLEDFDIENIDTNVLRLNDFYYTLKRFNEKNIDINKTYDNLSSLLLEQIAKHNTVSLAKDPNGYDVNQYLHSGSINLNNYRVFLNEGDDDVFDFDVSNLELKENNPNILVVTLNVFLKSNRFIKAEIKKEIPFSNDIKPFINKIILNNLDQFYSVDYESLSKLSLDEFIKLTDKKVFFKPRINGIENFFNFDIESYQKYQDKHLYFKFNVLFNKQIIKTAIIPTLNTVDFLENNAPTSQQDAKDLAEIQKILKGSKEYFYSILKFKPNTYYTHAQYLASDAIKAFDDVYDLPKFGKYKIFIKDVINVDNYNATADLILWYKINGKEAPIKFLGDLYANPIHMINFKLQDFFDIKPKNGDNFTESDFDGYKAIDANDARIFDNLNEANIQQVRVNGQVWGNGNVSNYFSIINARDFIQQRHFFTASYFFKIESGSASNKTDNKDLSTYIPFGTGNYDKDVVIYPINNNDINRIRNRYFTYYYDFKLVGKRGLSFRIGFIDKQHQDRRYSPNQTFTLINFVNDYQQLHYPQIMLNNLTYDDISVDNNKLVKHTISYYQSHLDDLNQIIKIKSNNGILTYRNFDLPASEIRIDEIQAIDATSAYIRFGVNTFDGSNASGHVKSLSWFKINGFQTENPRSPHQNPVYSNNDANSLRTIYNAPNNVHRERVLELYWKDALWSINKDTNTIFWTLQHKILDPMFTQNTSNRKLILSFNGGAIIQNGYNISITENPAFDVEFDYDEIKEKQIVNVAVDVTKNKKKFTFMVQASWNNNNIDFALWTKNPANKIIIDPRNATSSVTKELSGYKFLFANGAATLKVKYDSTQQTEDFHWNTNAFDYSKIMANTFNQPYLFYNKPEYLFDHNIYNPNQNVSFKFHDGYKMQLESIRLKEYGKYSELVRAIIGRSIAYSPGGAIATASMLGKVNNDPNDGRFYVITNHHAQSSGIWDFSLISGKNLFFRTSDITISAPFLQEVTYATRGRYGWTDYTSADGNEATTIWIGIQQYNNNGDPLLNTNRTPERLDATIIIVDINKQIAKARNEGKFDLALYLENWFKLNNAKIDYTWKYNNMNSPVTKDVASISYPRANQTAILDHRPARYYVDSTLGMDVGYQQNYAPFYSGAGASGTGRYIGDDSFASLWNSGVGFLYSVSWNYDALNYNYFGVNWNGEHPFELKNKHSFASQIIRANAVNPNKYALPWFMKQIKEK
ncbi:MGA_1079 family surface serine endopeptidase [Mycoplasma sp. 246B]